MTGVLCALAGAGVRYSGSSSLTIGTGGYDFTSGGYRFVDTTYGYNPGSSPPYGSMTNNVFGPGANITQLRWDYFRTFTDPGGVPVSELKRVILVVNQVISNSGWTSIVINGTTYTRSSANYSTDSTTTTWSWDAPTNTFGTSGTIAVSWG